jgi:hypothetical protein
MLLSQAQERRLGWREKLGIELHMMLCDGCTNFHKQLDFIRAAIRHYRDGGGAR